MNHEMMLFQARQDFIDLHQEILKGKVVTLEKYDSITSDLVKVDDLNFELMLQFVEKTDGFNIGQMWKVISVHIQDIKNSEEWNERKSEKVRWREGHLETVRE
jgi:hypothetical protein